MLKRFLFPDNVTDRSASIALLILRVVFGVMLMTHGWAKLMNFSEMTSGFPGGELGLGLVVFAEFFCSFAVIFGFLFRLSLIPMMVTMIVAFLMVHKAKLVGEGNGEMAFLYLAVFVALYISGPGKYALDRIFISKKDE